MSIKGKLISSTQIIAPGLGCILSILLSILSSIHDYNNFCREYNTNIVNTTHYLVPNTTTTYAPTTTMTTTTTTYVPTDTTTFTTTYVPTDTTTDTVNTSTNTTIDIVYSTFENITYDNVNNAYRVFNVANNDYTYNESQVVKSNTFIDNFIEYTCSLSNKKEITISISAIMSALFVVIGILVYILKNEKNTLKIENEEKNEIILQKNEEIIRMSNQVTSRSLPATFNLPIINNNEPFTVYNEPIIEQPIIDSVRSSEAQITVSHVSTAYPTPMNIV